MRSEPDDIFALPAMDYKTIVDEVNRKAYTSRSVLSWYRDLEIIQDAERTILEEITAQTKDKRLLDYQCRRRQDHRPVASD